MVGRLWGAHAVLEGRGSRGHGEGLVEGEGRIGVEEREWEGVPGPVVRDELGAAAADDDGPRVLGGGEGTGEGLEVEFAGLWY